MARTQEGPAWKPRGELKLLDTDIPRVDGPDKVSGRAKYTHDIRVPGMLYGRALMCPRPAARVTVDVARALQVPGVKVALALTDSLGDEKKTGYLGQPIAAVAAETPEQAEDGLRAIRAEYEDVGWVVTHDQAVAEDAPRVPRRGDQDGNEAKGRTSGDRIEVGAALEGCAAVVEATYTMPVQHHACLETHGVVVDYRGGDEATIYASTQATFGVASPADEILGVPKANIHVVVDHMGGGFGSKFSLDVTGRIACQLAKAAGAPVHLMFTRRDEFLAGGNRSGGRQTLKGGATKDGRFVALDASVTRLGGIGGGASAGQPYIYKAEQTYSESRSVFTNTDSGRAMRAPGHPQSSFAIESLVDELAHGIGMDPLEFRMRNLEDPVYHRQLERVAQEIGWHDHPNRTGPPDEPGDRAVGIGFGVATWGGGGRPSSQVEVRIESDGSVTSSVGSQDLGTGTRTYVAAIPAEELGLPIERVTARIGSSKLGMSVGSGGSVTTASLAPAVQAAAHDARVKLFEKLAPLMGTTPDKLAAAGGDVFETTDPSNRLSWTAACKSLGASPIVGNGAWVKELQASGVHGAQAAKVEVDTLTGEVRVLKMVGIQDCGLPLNRLATRSQLNGGMIQALSYGLFEERVIDPWLGTLLSGGFEDYRIAGSMDMPEMVAILDDDDDRHAVIGMGEPAVIPGQSAIANAVFNACGARIRDLPLTRDKVLAALGRIG